MLQRNLLYTGVTRGKRLVVPEGGCRYCCAQRLGSAALVEVGGMAQCGRREALRECIMSGVTAPPWRSRLYLASRKCGTSQLHRSMHQIGPLYSQLPTYRCGAANRRFGPISDIRGQWLLLRQLGEKHLRLLQIERVEAFGEPVVDRSKQFASLLWLTPRAPKTR